MSFERWITRLAEGFYTDYGDTEDLFPCVHGEWGCLFLLRLAQAPTHLDAVKRASDMRPEEFFWRIGHGLASLVWRVEHPLHVRQAAVAAAALMLESASSAAKAGGGAYMLWDNVVSLRGLYAVPGDEEEMVQAIRAAIQVNIQSPTDSIRESAEHGLWHLEERT